MATIEIRKIGITDLDTDAIVNAADAKAGAAAHPAKAGGTA